MIEGTKVFKGESLFPRVETDGKKAEKPAPAPKKAEVSKKPQENNAPLIDIELFRQVDLRVGLITEAEKVPQSEKLVKLIVDIGEKRQIVAGIAKTHSPEDLIGKQVVIVANLKPAKLMGIESRGMILAVRDADDLKLIVPEAKVAPGGKIS